MRLTYMFAAISMTAVLMAWWPMSRTTAMCFAFAVGVSVGVAAAGGVRRRVRGR